MGKGTMVLLTMRRHFFVLDVNKDAVHETNRVPDHAAAFFWHSDVVWVPYMETTMLSNVRKVFCT